MVLRNRDHKRQFDRGLSPRECFGQLLRDPFCRRVRCHIDPDKLSSSQPNNDQSVEQVEADGRDREQIHGRDVRHMIAQEGAPALTGRAAAVRPVWTVHSHAPFSSFAEYGASSCIAMVDSSAPIQRDSTNSE